MVASRWYIKVPFLNGVFQKKQPDNVFLGKKGYPFYFVVFAYTINNNLACAKKSFPRIQQKGWWKQENGNVCSLWNLNMRPFEIQSWWICWRIQCVCFPHKNESETAAIFFFKIRNPLSFSLCVCLCVCWRII